MNTNRSHAASDAIDSRIDRALAGLHDAQPRSGLNGRILASLQHRATSEATNPGGLPVHSFIVKAWSFARGRGPRRASLPGSGSARGNARGTAQLVTWAATSAAFLAVASLIVVHRQVAPSTKPVILSEASQSHREADSKDRELPQVSLLRPELAPVQVPTGHTPSTRRHPERSVAQRRTSVFQNCSGDKTDQCEIVAVSGTAQNLDAQALSDLHAPSHPAPPLPLTPQEKLFLRVLRYGNATQLAELNPLVRAQQDADETIAFKAFFPDPPPLKQPGDDE
ncbi:MAG TPA: hypothetical protein VFW30_01155 [Bryocella sp.]|nr:hypothetical protein [Bryocella sp.]